MPEGEFKEVLRSFHYLCGYIARRSGVYRLFTCFIININIGVSRAREWSHSWALYYSRYCSKFL